MKIKCLLPCILGFACMAAAETSGYDNVGYGDVGYDGAVGYGATGYGDVGYGSTGYNGSNADANNSATADSSKKGGLLGSMIPSFGGSDSAEESSQEGSSEGSSGGLNISMPTTGSSRSGLIIGLGTTALMVTNGYAEKNITTADLTIGYQYAFSNLAFISPVIEGSVTFGGYYGEMEVEERWSNGYYSSYRTREVKFTEAFADVRLTALALVNISMVHIGVGFQLGYGCEMFNEGGPDKLDPAHGNFAAIAALPVDLAVNFSGFSIGLRTTILLSSMWPGTGSQVNLYAKF